MSDEAEIEHDDYPEFDDYYCECQNEVDEEELASNCCKACGKQII